MGMLRRFLKSSNSSWVLEPVLCPSCRTTNVVKNGKSDEAKQRYRCRNPELVAGLSFKTIVIEAICQG
jgi:hypothetical protein